MACQLASPWVRPLEEAQKDSKVRACWRVKANVTDSGLFGQGRIHSVRFAESQGPDRCWWRQNHEDQGSGEDPQKHRAGVQDRELKKLEFWTEGKDGHWEL